MKNLIFHPLKYTPVENELRFKTITFFLSLIVSPLKQTLIESVEEIDSITTNTSLKNKRDEEAVRKKIIIDVVDGVEKKLKAEEEEVNMASEVNTTVAMETAEAVEKEIESVEEEKENAIPDKMELTAEKDKTEIAATHSEIAAATTENVDSAAAPPIDLSKVEFNFKINSPSLAVDKLEVLNSLYKNHGHVENGNENDDARSEVSEVSECGSTSDVTKTKKTKFVCEDCGRSFKKNAFLLTHRRSHKAKSKPTPTEIIEQSYAQRDLKTKSFLCQICHKEYKSQGFLNRHMRTVHK